MAPNSSPQPVQTEALPRLGIRRTLGLRDLVLFNMAGIIGLRWLSVAGHAGPGSLLLFFLAALLFFVPSAFAVATLSARYPEQGGLYAWTRDLFGPWHGFLCFWLYWMNMLCWFPSAAMAYASMTASAWGPQYAHWADNRFYVLGGSLLLLWMALGINLLSVPISKWVQNLGGLAFYVLAAILAVLAFMVWLQRGSATSLHLLPAWNWEKVNFWSQIAFAFTGLEMAPMMGEEIQAPEQALPRAAWISAAGCTAFYTLSTLALLVLVPSENISILHGLAQGWEVAGHTLHLAWLPGLCAGLLVVGAVGQLGANGAATARLPFSVSRDGYLPASLSNLHPRWGTPSVSLLTMAIVCSVSLILVQVGETLRSAYQILVDLMVIATFIPFGYIFLCAARCGRRWSAACGLAVVLIAVTCAVVPTADAVSVWQFEAKLLGGCVLIVLSARWLFRRGEAKRSSAA